MFGAKKGELKPVSISLTRLCSKLLVSFTLFTSTWSELRSHPPLAPTPTAPCHSSTASVAILGVLGAPPAQQALQALQAQQA